MGEAVNEFEQTVHDLLTSMGSTPDEVSDTIRRAGIRGHQYSSATCPVARYLSRELAKRWDAPVVAYTWDRTTVCSDHGILNIPTPLPVLAFDRAFDDCKYPELIEPGVPGLD